MNQPPARLMPTRNAKAKAVSYHHHKAPTSQSLVRGTALGISVMCLSLAPAFAGAILYWDGDGAGQVGGGAGTWDTTLARWSTTSDGVDQYQVWNNANNDDAVFGGTASNAVIPTAGQPITVNSISFKVTGYTIGVSATPANPINLNTGNPTGTLTIDVTSGQAIINAVYNPATISTILKTGNGLFSSGFSQPTTGGYTGKWIVEGGTLSLPGDLRLGKVPTDIVPDQVTLNGGVLRSSTATVAFDAKRGIVLGDAGGGVNSDNTVSFTWNGPITGGVGTFTKQGSTNLILTNNTSNYGGQTIVQAGRLTVNAANALGLSTAGTEVRANAGVVFFGASTNFTIAEPFRIAGPGAGADGGALSFQSGANVTVSGPVTLFSDAALSVSGDSTAVFNNANAIAAESDNSLTLGGGAVTTGGGGTVNGGISLGFGSLRKQEAGTWTLGGLSVYSGSTTIDDGTLIVSGTISGTAQVDVGGVFNAKLAGSGTIAPGAAGNVNLYGNGKIAPGVGVGAGMLTLALNGGLLDLKAGIAPTNTLALLFELLAPATSDKVVLTGGTIDIGNGLLEFDDFSFSTLPGFVGNGDYVLFDGSSPLIGTLGANLTGTIGGLDASLILADGGRDIVLHLVPEPSAAAALLGGAATLLGLRRRRNS